MPIPGCRCEVCQSDDPKNKRYRVSIYVELFARDRGLNESADKPAAAILIDTTPDLRTQALTFGFSRIDAVLYTHGHADHVFGIDDLRSFNFTQKKVIPVYANEECAAMLQHSFRYCFFQDPDYEGGSPPRLTLNKIRANEPLELFGCEILPLRVEHGTMEVLAFRFGRFAYVTDCSAIPPESRKLLKGLKVLILDGLRHRPHKTHLTLEQAAAIADELAAERTFLTHISHEVDHDEGNAFLAEISSSRIELAYDGLQLDC